MQRGEGGLEKGGGIGKEVRERRGYKTYDRELHLVACSLDPNRAQIVSQLGGLLQTLFFATAGFSD